MLRTHIVLLIAIRPSDGDVKPGGPPGSFREEQAMSRQRVSPSPFLSSSSHTTQLHYTNSYPYSHHNLNHYTDSRPARNVVCQTGAWIENRSHSTPSIRPARNPKGVIVQWVGIGTHIHIIRIIVHWNVSRKVGWYYHRKKNIFLYLETSVIMWPVITKIINYRHWEESTEKNSKHKIMYFFKEWWKFKPGVV